MFWSFPPYGYRTTLTYSAHRSSQPSSSLAASTSQTGPLVSYAPSNNSNINININSNNHNNPKTTTCLKHPIEEHQIRTWTPSSKATITLINKTGNNNYHLMLNHSIRRIPAKDTLRRPHRSSTHIPCPSYLRRRRVPWIHRWKVPARPLEKEVCSDSLSPLLFFFSTFVCLVHSLFFHYHCSVFHVFFVGDEQNKIGSRTYRTERRQGLNLE